MIHGSNQAGALAGAQVVAAGALAGRAVERAVQAAGRRPVTASLETTAQPLLDGPPPAVVFAAPETTAW